MSGRIEGKLFPLHELIPLALYEADRWVVENGWLESTDMNYKMVRSTIDKSDSSIEMDYIHYTPQGLATFFNTSSNIITNEFRDNKKTMNEIIEIKKGIKPVMVTEEGNKVVAYKQSAYHLKHSLKKQIKCSYQRISQTKIKYRRSNVEKKETIHNLVKLLKTEFYDQKRFFFVSIIANIANEKGLEWETIIKAIPFQSDLFHMKDQNRNSVRITQNFKELAISDSRDISILNDIIENEDEIMQTLITPMLKKTEYDPYHRGINEGDNGEDSQIPNRMYDMDIFTLDHFYNKITTEKKNWTIIGEAGAGKSTILKILIRRASNDYERGTIPFLINVRDYDGSSFEDYLIERATERRSPIYKDMVFKKCLEEGRCLFLLDGLDEMDDDTYEQFFNGLKKFHKNHCYRENSNRLVMTTRPIEYLFDDYTSTVEVLPIDLLERNFYIDRIFKILNESGKGTRLKEMLDSDLIYQDLASIPLMLNSIILGFKTEGWLPRTGADLLKQILEIMIQRGEQRSKSKQNLLGRKELKIKILSEIALKMVVERKNELSSFDFINLDFWNDLRTNEISLDIKQNILGQLVNDDRILRPFGINYIFFHQSIIEFLCAHAIDDMDQRDKYLLNDEGHTIDEKVWWPIYKQYGGMKQPDELIKSIFDKHPEDIFLSNLRLAIKVIGQGNANSETKEMVLKKALHAITDNNPDSGSMMTHLFDEKEYSSIYHENFIKLLRRDLLTFSKVFDINLLENLLEKYDKVWVKNTIIDMLINNSSERNDRRIIDILIRETENLSRGTLDHLKFVLRKKKEDPDFLFSFLTEVVENRSKSQFLLNVLSDTEIFDKSIFRSLILCSETDDQYTYVLRIVEESLKKMFEKPIEDPGIREEFRLDALQLFRQSKVKKMLERKNEKYLPEKLHEVLWDLYNYLGRPTGNILFDDIQKFRDAYDEIIHEGGTFLKDNHGIRLFEEQFIPFCNMLKERGKVYSEYRFARFRLLRTIAPNFYVESLYKEYEKLFDIAVNEPDDSSYFLMELITLNNPDMLIRKIKENIDNLKFLRHCMHYFSFKTELSPILLPLLRKLNQITEEDNKNTGLSNTIKYMLEVQGLEERLLNFLDGQAINDRKRILYWMLDNEHVRERFPVFDTCALEKIIGMYMKERNYRIRLRYVKLVSLLATPKRKKILVRLYEITSVGNRNLRFYIASLLLRLNDTTLLDDWKKMLKEGRKGKRIEHKKHSGRDRAYYSPGTLTSTQLWYILKGVRSPEAEVDILFFLILNGLVEKNDCIDHTGIHFYDRMMPVFDEMWNKVISGNWDGKKVMLAKEILFECSYPRLEEHFDIKTLRKGDSEIIDYYWNIAMMASKFYPDVELEMDSDDVENLINKLLRLSEECKEKDLWKIYWAVYMLMALADEKEMDIESCEALFQQLISKMLSSNYLESRVFAINWIFIDMNEGYSDDKYLIPDPQLISYLKHFDEELKISDSFVIFISHMKKVDGHKRSYKEKTPWNDVSRNPNYNYSLQRFSTFQKSIPINIKLNGHNFIIERTNKAIKKGTYAYEELIRMCNFNRNSIAYDSLYDYYHFITQFEWYMAYPKLLLDYYYKFPKLEIVFTKEKFLENAIGKESFKRFIFDHHLRPTISAEFLRDSELLQKVLDLYPETRLLLLHWFGYPANHCERIVRDASEKNLFRFLSGLQEFLYQNEPPDHLESLLEEIIQNTSNCIIRRAALNCLSHFPKNEVFQKYLLEEVEHIVSEQADNDCDEGSLKMMDPWPLYRVESRHSTHDYDDSSYIGKNIFYPHDEEDCVYHERVSLFVQLYRCYGKDFLKCLLDICSSQTGLKSVKTLMLACVKFWLEIMGYSSLYEDFKDIPEIAQFAHQCYRSGYGIFKDNWGIVMRKEGTEHFSKPSIRIPVIWFQKALGTTAE